MDLTKKMAIHQAKVETPDPEAIPPLPKVIKMRGLKAVKVPPAKTRVLPRELKKQTVKAYRVAKTGRLNAEDYLDNILADKALEEVKRTGTVSLSDLKESLGM